MFCYVFWLYFSIVLASSPPTWPDVYTVDGILELPYAEIKEPFFVFFDKNLGRSRIDYYGGK